MQIKTASVAAVSASVGFKIRKWKTKVLKFKAENRNPITLDGETLEDVESFTYLGSIIVEQGGSDAGQDWQSKGSIPTIEEHIELKTTVCQPISKLESSIPTSRQFYCT
ncbi:unnamed protein product [Schistosoma margrebowiei]|uniref:Uncharacterized protein n=1 Tax=Schistosoma margrebowiei TaxID=48269 RepID=A0A183MPG7_9TREM|nr:unnamed protein product [Schistosoma margrebowiei]